MFMPSYLHAIGIMLSHTDLVGLKLRKLNLVVGSVAAILRSFIFFVVSNRYIALQYSKSDNDEICQCCFSDLSSRQMI